MNELESIMYPLTDLFIAKKKDESTKINYVYKTKGLYLEKEYYEFMNNIRKNNPNEFIEKLVKYNLRNPLIKYLESTEIILPKKYQNNYQDAICFGTSSNDFNLYFVDEAINEFPELIEFLRKKAYLDSLNYLKKAIEEEAIANLAINISKQDGIKGFVVKGTTDVDYNYFVENNLAEDDYMCIDSIIEDYSKTFGTFSTAERDVKKITANNKHQLEIRGIDNDERLAKKVLTLVK